MVSEGFTAVEDGRKEASTTHTFSRSHCSWSRPPTGADHGRSAQFRTGELRRWCPSSGWWNSEPL